MNPSEPYTDASSATTLSTTFVLQVVAVLACFALLYRSVIVKLVSDWATDDNYSHGFLIVPIALYLAWERREKVLRLPLQPSLMGLLLVLASVAVLAAGVLGAELFLTRVSMLGVLAGAIVFLFGWQHLRALFFPVAFLVLMIPLPAIIFNKITFPLQLFASQAGEFGLASIGVPVLREGNIIVLARTKLEVVEACSGIRSLVSLLTLGIVYAYFIDTRLTVRWLISLSAVPVAIIANALRITGTGVAAHYYGPEAAEGFFHSFSGWAVFVVAFLAMLAVKQLVVQTANLTARTRLWRSTSMSQSHSTLTRTIALCVCLVGATVALTRASKQEQTPLREPLTSLPMKIGGFTGARATDLDQAVIDLLGVEDWVNRVYRTGPGQLPVGLYMGYWASQRQGDTIHSPMNCLPGSGWQPTETGRVTIPLGSTNAEVNRVIIEKSGERMLVYYWYQSQGRVVASEYWSKIHMVVNAMRTNRTDAAMVRVVVPIPARTAESEQAAEQEAATFVRDLFPLLGRHLPA